MAEKQKYQEPTAVAMAVFYDRRIAMGAINDLKRQKFYSHEIGIASTDSHKRGRRSPDIVGRNHAKGTVAGLIAGGVIGVVAGVTLSLVAGLGLLVGAGTGLVTGLVLGALLGALTGMGIPRRDPNYYSKPLDAGRTIVIVATNERGDEARDILRRNGGRDLDEQEAQVNVAGRSMVRTPAAHPAPVGSTPTA